jgi:hypothetical protein
MNAILDSRWSSQTDLGATAAFLPRQEPAPSVWGPGGFRNRSSLSGVQTGEPLQSPRRFPTDLGSVAPDPYKRSSAEQGLRSGWVLRVSRASGAAAPPEESVSLWVGWENRVKSVPKTVASFVGKVESLGEAVAIVTLVNEATKERLESQCDTEVLRENGIGAGDEFRCEVVRTGGETATRLMRLPPKPLSRERVAEIRASFKDRWDF